MNHSASSLILAAVLMASIDLSASAQEAAKTPTDKWRPKDGTYAEPGPDFNARCGEFGDTQIDWGGKLISGGEEGCRIAKLSDTAPGSIRLDVVCHSAESEGRPYKEIILLRKIDDKTIFLRETQDGKFKRAGGPMSYCPDDAQQLYNASRKKN